VRGARVMLPGLKLKSVVLAARKWSPAAASSNITWPFDHVLAATVSLFVRSQSCPLLTKSSLLYIDRDVWTQRACNAVSTLA
jgi:hypothetical protein